MIVESGVIIFLGLLLIFIKLPKRTALRLLGHPLAIDIVVSIFTLLVHWGMGPGSCLKLFSLAGEKAAFSSNELDKDAPNALGTKET